MCDVVKKNRNNTKKKGKWVCFGLFCLVLSCFGVVWTVFEPFWGNPKVVRIYCASVLKPVVEGEILRFEKAHDCDVRVEYGGSGVLLERAKLSGVGDLYLAAERFYLARAERDGLVFEGSNLAGMRLVVAVRAGNPKGVVGLADFLKLDYVMCDDRAAVGFVLRGVMEKLGIYEEVLRGAKAVKPTVSMLGGDVKLGSVDGAFIWDTTAKQFGLRVIELDEFKGVGGVAAGAVFRGATEVDLAGKFLKVLQSERVKQEFLKFGFQAVK